MKFVALLSGGKDSCCNVWKCEQEGHELVCLANLCPPEGAGEELNSFMYQSAAHGVIPKLAECFGVPLIRQDITGSAVCQDLDYVHGSDDTTRRDEVEDLYELLLKVVQQYPEVKGVELWGDSFYISAFTGREMYVEIKADTFDLSLANGS